MRFAAKGEKGTGVIWVRVHREIIIFLFVLFSFSAGAETYQSDQYGDIPPDVKIPKHTLIPSEYGRYKFIGSTFYVEGNIDPYLADMLIERLRDISQPQITLAVLNSFGGDIHAAVQIAKAIRAYGLATLVPASGTCASACVTVFMGGVKRKAARSSVFLEHGVRAGEASMRTHYKQRVKREGEVGGHKLWAEWEAEARANTDLMFTHKEELGASPELRKKYMSLPHESNYFERGNPMRIVDWRMNAVEAKDYNIVTELF